ncbi:MAG: winged helix-turn-helix transcriptional regulator [Thermoleophilaceae bacterium]|nr:winged helix-turn-helix transcriptional regulator [Thermoleophilaceae bacterium]
MNEVSPPGGEVLRAGRLEIRPRDYAALVDGRAVALTVRELELLTALARRPERIVSREELYAVVWGQPFHKHDRSVDVYVAKLRMKLERELPDWRYIHTHFGFGYRFSAERLQVLHKQATDR